MRLYMAVTADQYELPICVSENAKELAEALGITSQAVWAACTPSRTVKNRKCEAKRDYRIVRIFTNEKGPALHREPKG